MKKGKLVIIEGTDGAGKSTQLKKLLEYFKKNNVKASTFDFPQYEKTFFGAFVAGFLNGEFGRARNINPYFASIPYAGDRWQAKDDLKKELDNGKIVVCDRYATSSMAYHSVKLAPPDRSKFIDWQEKLEYEVFGIPKEDLVIYLYVPLKIAQELMSYRKKKAYLNGHDKDQHEENVGYLKKVEKMYLWLSKYKKNWVRIDCVKNGKMRSIEDIHEEIVKILYERCGF